MQCLQRRVITALAVAGASVTVGAPATAATHTAPLSILLGLGTGSVAPPGAEEPLCSFGFYEPGASGERSENVSVSVAPAGAGKTKFVFRTRSAAPTSYTQRAAVTWANLDTGLNGGGYDSGTQAEISAGTTTLTLPIQTVGTGRITVVASVSNTRGTTATSYDDCVAEYSAQ